MQSSSAVKSTPPRAKANAPEQSAQRTPVVGFKSREDYLKFIEDETPRRGKEWRAKKLAEMEARDAARKQQRDEAENLWRLRVNDWSSSGGFEQVLGELSLGQPSSKSGPRQKFNVGGVPFEINVRKQGCTRWDSGTFSNGRRGRAGAYGLALCYFELIGSANPRSDARELIARVSGIAVDGNAPAPDAAERIAEFKKRQELESARRKDAENREDPLTEEESELVPTRITDPEDIERLTAMVAKERSFPLEYARRLVAEGTIWFGTYKYRDERTGRVVDTRRPIVLSDVRGIATGKVITHVGRELKDLCPEGSGKGKNYPNTGKGVVVIGNWSETTTRIHLVEGVYDGAALRLIGERLKRPLKDDEAIIIFAGARVPERLIEQCAKRKIEVVGCFDRDIAGFDLVDHLKELADKHGVQHKVQLPARGEFDLSLQNNDWGRRAYTEFSAQLTSAGVKFLHQQASDTSLSLVGETNAASCAALKELRRQSHDASDGLPKETKTVGIGWHRKDWNELIQQSYELRAQTPAGLPAIDNSVDDEFNEFLRHEGIPDGEIEALRRALLVYPGRVNGGYAAVWPAIDPDTATPLGFISQNLGNRTLRHHGASFAAGMLIGNLRNADRVAIADTPAKALAAWRSRAQRLAVVVPLGRELPAAVAKHVVDRQMEIIPCFGSDEQGLTLEGALSQWARMRGLKLGMLPDVRTSSPSPSI